MSAGKQKLRLVQLAADGALTVGEFALTLAEQIPFAVQAEVREEDTFLVLSADSRLDAGRDHPLRVMTSAFTFEPVEPGTVLVRQGEPLELLAVIHDLDQRPSTCDEWVQRALSGVFEACERHRLAALALPLLGSVHRALSTRHAATLLGRALRDRPEASFPRRVWVQVARTSLARIDQQLRQALS